MAVLFQQPHVVFLMTTIFRFRTKLRHLCYCNKWQFHSAVIGGFMHFVMYALPNVLRVLHNVTPIDFDIRRGC